MGSDFRPAVPAVLAAALLLSPPAGAHDWYGDKKTANGGSCCNGSESGGDCERVRAWQNSRGAWMVIWRGEEHEVPASALRPDSENPEPFQASACVHAGSVRCFWRKVPGG